MMKLCKIKILWHSWFLPSTYGLRSRPINYNPKHALLRKA